MLPVLAVLLSAVSARATPVLVVDAETLEVLHGEDAGHPWYPASTTKLMTAFVVFESLRASQVAMGSTVVLSRNAMRQGFLNAGLRTGSAMTLEDALFTLIAGSANDVAVAIAEAVAGSVEAFVGRMNDAAARLGMTATNFTNPNGLFDRRQHTSARDLAILGIAIDRYFPEHQRFFKASRVVVDGTVVDSRNELLARFPGTIGMKTGFVCSSGRNMVALAERGGRKVLAVVLGATTDRERNERTALLFTQAFAGQLRPTGGTLVDVVNDTSQRPVDMRPKLCSDQTAAYERARAALYPMGLPGKPSYLDPPGAVVVHEVKTWQTPVPATIPLPTRHPLR